MTDTVFLTNTSTLYGPTVGVQLLPDYYEDPDVVGSPRYVGVMSADGASNVSVVEDASATLVSRPSFLGSVGNPFDASIVPTPIEALPSFFTNASVVNDLDPDIHLILPKLTNSSNVFNAMPVYPRTMFPSKIDNASKLFSAIAKVQPRIVEPVSPELISRSPASIPKSERLTSDVNKTYKDFSLMFRPHPLTGDVTRVFDYDAIIQSAKILIMTNVFERPYSSQDFAGSIKAKLFALGGDATTRDIKEEITRVLIRHEPRVLVENVSVEEDGSNNSIVVGITIRIRTFEKSETFNLFLDRA